MQWGLPSTANVKVVVLARPPLVVPKGAVRYHVGFQMSGRRAGRLSVPVIWMNSEGDVIGEARVMVEADVRLPVVRARSDIWKGSVLQESDLVVAEESMTGKPSNVFLSMVGLAGKKVVHHIGAGALIVTTSLKAPVDISSGSVVDILLTDGAVEVRVKGEALSDGRIGGTIKVRTQYKTPKFFSGEVLDSSTVKVRI